MQNRAGMIVAIVVGLGVAVAIPVGLALRGTPDSTQPANDLPPAPNAKVAGEFIHDFGDLEHTGRQTLKHTFTVRNADTKSLDMQVEGTSCECATGELKTNVLEPGESVDVDVVVLVGKPGPVHQKVYLNASGALIILEVKANIIERPFEPPPEDDAATEQP